MMVLLLVGVEARTGACIGAAGLCVVLIAAAASVTWERCVASEAKSLGTGRKDSLSLRVKPSPVNLYAYHNGPAPCQGYGCTEHVPVTKG